MRAVQSAERPAAAQWGWRRLQWASWPLLVAVGVLVVWHAQRGPAPVRVQDVQTLAAASTALELGDQVARTAPAVVVAPLADEWGKLNRDLDETAQFLLASLP